jgi:hypothetical protein
MPYFRFLADTFYMRNYNCTVLNLTSKMKATPKKKNPLVFMDVSIDGDPVKRMVFEVRYILSIYYLSCSYCSIQPNV